MNANDPLMQAYIQMLMRDPGREALGQQVGAYDALGPEGYKQIVDSNSLGDRSKLARQNAVDQASALERQLAMSQALMAPKQEHHTSMAGTIGSGIGNIFSSVLGGIKSHGLQEQQQNLLSQGNAQQTGLLDQMDAAHVMGGNAQMEAARRFLAQQQAMQQAQQPQEQQPQMQPPPLLAKPDGQPQQNPYAFENFQLPYFGG